MRSQISFTPVETSVKFLETSLGQVADAKCRKLVPHNLVNFQFKTNADNTPI